MWFEPYIGAWLYAREAGQANRAAAEQQRRQYESARAATELFMTTDGTDWTMVGLPIIGEAHPSACENCGSSEYKHHHGRLICSYCRSAP